VRSTLDELETELAELKAFVASIANVNETFSAHQDVKVRRFSALRRRFDNAAFVVALYASFESYIEKLATAFAVLETQRLPYADLPQRLAAKHLQRSADLLARGRLGEGRHAGLTHAGVVANLHGCLSGAIPYVLNNAAVVWHDTNFRVKEVDEMFQPLGIEAICTQIRRGDFLTRWYITVQGLSASPNDGVPATVIEERLNDIVQRRNAVAHRGGNPGDLLGVADMDEAIDFISAISKDFFAVVVGNYLNARHPPTSGTTRLTLVPGDGPYMDGKVVVVSPPGISLSVGQAAFVIKGSGSARWGRITSMRLDNTNLQTFMVGTPAPKGIGIGLDFSCPQVAAVVVLSEDDDLVWAPTIGSDSSPSPQADTPASDDLPAAAGA
jgi:hypothetical protein